MSGLSAPVSVVVVSISGLEGIYQIATTSATSSSNGTIQRAGDFFIPIFYPETAMNPDSNSRQFVNGRRASGAPAK
jgi:hypothetical protein